MEELRPMQVVKRLSLSSSTAYILIQDDLSPLYLRKKSETPSKRDRQPRNPVYELTPNGILLLGFLLRKKALIIEALESNKGNPLYKLSVAVYKKVPAELIFDAAYRMLMKKQVSMEVFFDAIVIEFKSKITPDQMKELRLDLDAEYRTYSTFERDIIFEYVREKFKHQYLLGLRGEELKNYYNEARKNLDKIVFFCQKCKKTMKTSNPFETKTICSNCSKNT